MVNTKHCTSPQTPSPSWSMVVAASCCGDASDQQALEGLLRLRVKSMKQNLGINQIQCARDIQLRTGFIFKQDNGPNHTVKATVKRQGDEWSGDLEWLSQSPDLDPIQNLWLDCSQPIVVQSDRAWAVLQREWSKIAVSRCASMLQTYPQRLSAVTEAKRCSY